MIKLKREPMKTTDERSRFIKRWKMVFALVLLAGFASVTISLNPRVVSADGGEDHGAADVTFTKWVITLPSDPATLAGVLMAGVVGGDVGPGRYAGQVLSDDTTSMPGFWLGHASYEFFGSKHSFIADVHITENDTTVPIAAVIRGVVTQGWLKGARITGEYTQWDSCPIATPGNVFGSTCFQGTLHILRGDKD
jgi:hypothetical protein